MLRLLADENFNGDILRGLLLRQPDLDVVRVLYNVEGQEVTLLIVGRKVGNKLVVAGEAFYGHQNNFTEPAGGEPAGDVE